jgi:hypothetical protein
MTGGCPAQAAASATPLNPEAEENTLGFIERNGLTFDE